jgi:hypothetical protein
MPLSDLVTKAKIDVALAREPRVTSLDIGVQINDGVVTLTGDVDSDTQRRSAEEIARGVDGVRAVRNNIMCGLGRSEETADLVPQRLLDKLEEEWNNLPDSHALTQADYARWALWLVYKFRNRAMAGAGQAVETAETAMLTVDQALDRIGRYIGSSKALMAFEMLRQAEELKEHHEDAPDIQNAPLTSSPIAEDIPERAAA